MRNGFLRSRKWHGIAVLVLSAPTASMAAQEQAPEDEKVLALVEVVGTRIKRNDWETATPIHVISREDILNSGATSTYELLKRIPAAGEGALQDFNPGSGFSAGAATAALRGLGSNATLVLVNGRRFAASPYVDPNRGFSTTYNLNGIPVAAIERVEILKGGASAIYGSDAVAGVINIVLRKDYRISEAGVHYSFDEYGNFGNRRVHATIGFGDRDDQGMARYNAMLMVSSTRRDAVDVRKTRAIERAELDRLFARTRSLESDTASYPANYYVEASPGSRAFNRFYGRDARCPEGKVSSTLRCLYDRTPDTFTVAPQENNSVWGQFNVPVNGSLSLFSELGYSRVTAKYRNAPTAIGEGGSLWLTRNAEQRAFNFVLPAGHPDNPAPTAVALRYRFADLGRRETSMTSEMSRMLVGVKGANAGWEWDSSLSHNQTEHRSIDRGMLYVPELVSAIDSGAYRPFGANSEATISAVSPDIRADGRGAVTTWDVKGSRALAALPGGQLMLAAGAEIRWERTRLTPDERVANGEVVGVGPTQADGKRRIDSGFLELSVPVMKDLESQLAVRHDRYSDYGHSTTPQMGLKWNVHPSLALRSSYARGFRAPALSQIGESSLQGFVGGVTDPVRCGKPGADDRDCSLVTGVFLRANPDIEPEKSLSRTIGFIFSPTPAFDFSLDYYRIDRTNEIAQFGTAYMVRNEAELAGAILRDPNPATWLPGVPNSGPIRGVVDRYTNSGGSSTSGLDVDASLLTSLGAWGKVQTRFQGTYLLKFKSRYDDDDPFFESQGGLGIYGPLPRFKGSLSTTWKYSRFSVTGRVNHLSGWYYGDSDGCFESHAAWLASYDCRVKSWTTLDLAVRYAGTENLDLGFSVSNLQDKAAPLTPNNRESGFNAATHNPYGRYFTLWMNYRFL